MRMSSIKLYSFTAPLALLPLMSFSFDQVIPYLKGPEFRLILTEILIQAYSSIADTVILAGLQSVFGITTTT